MNLRPIGLEPNVATKTVSFKNFAITKLVIKEFFLIKTYISFLNCMSSSSFSNSFHKDWRRIFLIVFCMICQIFKIISSTTHELNGIHSTNHSLHKLFSSQITFCSSLYFYCLQTLSFFFFLFVYTAPYKLMIKIKNIN